MTTILYNAQVCHVCRDRYGVHTFRAVRIADCAVCAVKAIMCYTADRDQDVDPTLYYMGEIEFSRASADSLCRQCGKQYRMHPVDRRPEACGCDGEPFLHVLCDGKLVKL